MSEEPTSVNIENVPNMDEIISVAKTRQPTANTRYCRPRFKCKRRTGPRQYCMRRMIPGKVLALLLAPQENVQKVGGSLLAQRLSYPGAASALFVRASHHSISACSGNEVAAPWDGRAKVFSVNRRVKETYDGRAQVDVLNRVENRRE